MRRVIVILWVLVAVPLLMGAGLAPSKGPSFAPDKLTIEALGEIPQSCDVVISIENASRLRDGQAGRGLLELLRALGFTSSLEASWPGLARELDLSPEEAFDSLLGRRAIVAVRSGDGQKTTEFAFLTEVDRKTEERIRRMLKPAPRGLEIGFPILTIEGGRYEVAASELRGETPETETATLVIAPSGEKLFDELVSAVQGKGTGPKLRDSAAWKTTRERLASGKAPVLGLVGFGKGEQDERYAGFACWPSKNGWRVQFAAGSRAVEELRASKEPRTSLPSWLLSTRGPFFEDALFASAGSLTGVLPDDVQLTREQRGFLVQFLGAHAPLDRLGAPTAVAVYAEVAPSEAGGVTPVEVLMSFAAPDARAAAQQLDAKMAERVKPAAEGWGSSLGTVNSGDMGEPLGPPGRTVRSVVSWTVQETSALPETVGAAAPGWCAVLLGHRAEGVPADLGRIRGLAAAMHAKEDAPGDPRGEVVFRVAARPSELVRIFPGDVAELKALEAIERFAALAWLPVDGAAIVEGEVELEFVPADKAK